MFRLSPGDIVTIALGRTFCYVWPTAELWMKGSVMPLFRFDGLSTGLVLASDLHDTPNAPPVLLIIVEGAVGFISNDDVRRLT